MSIERLSDGGRRVRWYDQSGNHRSKTFKKGEAQIAKDFHDEVFRAKRLGYLPQLQASSKTVGEAAAEWWVNHGQHKGERTAKLYEGLLHNYVLPTWDGVRLGEITHGAVQGWHGKLDTGPTARNNALGILRQILNYAIKQEWIQSNPCLLVDKAKAPDREPVKPPSTQDVEQIREALLAKGRLGDATLVSVLAYAGLRPNEAWRLTWEDVRENTLLVRASKTGTFRTVDLLAPLRADLTAWKLASQPNPLVFPNAWGEAFTKTKWDNWRKRVWEKVAPEGMTPYACRHHFVSLLLADPSNSRVYVASQAGHSLQVQDQVYAHIMAEGRTQDATAAIRAAREEVAEPDANVAVR